MARKQPDIDGFMFDVDGTLILSNRSLGSYRVLPGAKSLLSKLNDQGIPFVLLTNGTAYPPPEQAAKLREAGLPVRDEQMLTPSSVAAAMMSQNGVKSALLLGIPGVGYALKEAGIKLLYHGDPGAETADAVYVGWHPECNLREIEAACNAIWNGAKLYVASYVPFFATSAGRTLGSSFAITAAIRALTKAPMILTGKPSLHALRFVAKQLGVPMRRVAVVGDDPNVEIIMAHRGGAHSFGVTTGFNKEKEWQAQDERHSPDYLLEGVNDLLDYI